jgi:SAM-dependent methyltransferase
LIKKITPISVLRWRQNILLQKELVRHDKIFHGKSSKEIFSKIYARKMWGGEGFDYYSGHGSHLQAHIGPYIKSVSEFLAQFPIPKNVVDLGCGDFHVASQIRSNAGSYIACDVVDDLILRNKTTYANLDVDFRVLDIIEDDLPQGDVVIIRQVLQHLSNSEIMKVVGKLKNFRHIVITEFVPTGNFVPNLDQQTGVFSRLARGVQSGIVLTSEPFSLSVKKEKIICETPESGGSLRVIVYEL